MYHDWKFRITLSQYQEWKKQQVNKKIILTESCAISKVSDRHHRSWMEFLHQLICDKVIELNLYLQQFCMISQGSNIKYMDGSTNVV